MVTLTKRPFSVLEYFKFEEQSEIKHEYRDGIVVPMAGASFNHNSVTENIKGNLYPLVQRAHCYIFGSDMRIQVKATGLCTYPDVSVVCGRVEFVKGRNDTITNPMIIIEVLSPSTRSYDRGDKFVLYRALESLQAYVLVDPDQVRIESFRKMEDGSWILTEMNI